MLKSTNLSEIYKCARILFSMAVISMIKKWKYVILAALAFLPLGYLGLQTQFESVAFIIGVSDAFLVLIMLLSVYEIGFSDALESKAAKSRAKYSNKITWLRIIALDLGVIGLVGMLFVLTLNHATFLTSFDTDGLGVAALIIVVVELAVLARKI